MLTSRSPGLPAADVLGDGILVMSADVTRLDQMRAAMQQARSRFGRIRRNHSRRRRGGRRGVSTKTREAADAVLAPKISGARVLESLAREARPDFMVLCSSLAALQGGFGQIDYVGGNAALDAFAAYHTQSSGIQTIAMKLGQLDRVRHGCRSRQAPARAPGIRGGLGGPKSGAAPLALPRLVLGEHRVGGVATLPGTAYLELVHAGYGSLQPSPGCLAGCVSRDAASGRRRRDG